jgi:hypothetical protein
MGEWLKPPDRKFGVERHGSSNLSSCSMELKVGDKVKTRLESVSCSIKQELGLPTGNGQYHKRWTVHKLLENSIVLNDGKGNVAEFDMSGNALSDNWLNHKIYKVYGR